MVIAADYNHYKSVLTINPMLIIKATFHDLIRILTIRLIILFFQHLGYNIRNLFRKELPVRFIQPMLSQVLHHQVNTGCLDNHVAFKFFILGQEVEMAGEALRKVRLGKEVTGRVGLCRLLLQVSCPKLFSSHYTGRL